MPGHAVPTDFPASLAEYDVVVLSDIGADSLLLHPDTFLRGRRTHSSTTCCSVQRRRRC